MQPNTLLLHLRDAIETAVTADKGRISIANSPFEVIEILGESPGNYRIILLWEGDEDAGGQPLAGVTTGKISVVVSHNRGLAIWKGETVHVDTEGRKSLLTHVHEIRKLVRAWEAPEDQTSMNPMYLGCDPETLPDGLPLDAYRLRFSLTVVITDDPEVEEEEP